MVSDWEALAAKQKADILRAKVKRYSIDIVRQLYGTAGMQLPYHKEPKEGRAIRPTMP